MNGPVGLRYVGIELHDIQRENPIVGFTVILDIGNASESDFGSAASNICGKPLARLFHHDRRVIQPHHPSSPQFPQACLQCQARAATDLEDDVPGPKGKKPDGPKVPPNVGRPRRHNVAGEMPERAARLSELFDYGGTQPHPEINLLLEIAHEPPRKQKHERR